MKSKRVLIADDDSTLVRILEHRFKALGAQTHGCHDAMHALMLIHRDPPDLVLLDITMPAGNGLAACEMLAEDPRLRDIPVIIMTGHANEQTAERCNALGATYIVKTGDVWKRLEPLVCALLDLRQPAAKR